MSSWIFTVSAFVLLLAGVLIAWRWGWRDTGKGMRRCPKCWYDMSASAGLKCPECGREAKAEGKLFWKQRRWRWMFTGLLLVVASYPVFKWPLYQKQGVIAFVPRVVTLALLPEISDGIRRWGPRKAKYGPELVLDLVTAKPLNQMERFALAHSYRRVMNDSARTPGYKAEFVMIAFSKVGDQVGVAADALASALSQPALQPAAMYAIANAPEVQDHRMQQLVGPASRAMASKAFPYPAYLYLEKLQAWGATEDQLREAAFGAIDFATTAGGDSSPLDFLWRENLVRATDRPRLFGYLMMRVWPFAQYASYCAAELGGDIAAIVPSLREEMTQSDLQAIPDWTCLAIAMREASEPLLPALDRFADFKRYPTFKVCGTVGGLAVRGCHSEAYDLWLAYIEQSDNSNAESVPQRYQISPLVMFLDVPASKKAEGLVQVMRAEALSSSPTGVSSNLLFAIDALGKLGADASDAVPALLELIEPNTMSFVVERVLRSIEKIRALDVDQLKTLETRVREWKPATGSTATVEARMERLRRASKDRPR